MSENKNIDQILGKLDSFLDIKEESLSVNVEEMAKLYQDKKLREQKGNSRKVIGYFLLGISLFLITPDTLARINMIIFGILLVLTYLLNYKAQKEIEQQNLAVSFNDFREQRKKIALASLKQFKGMRVIYYTAILIGFGIEVYDYIRDPHYLKIIIYSTTFVLGSVLTIMSIESAIKEFRGLVMAQE